jgi:hypothetical protein
MATPQITVAVGWDDSAVKSGVQGTNNQLQGMGDQWQGMLAKLATYAAGVFTVAKIKEFAEDSIAAAARLNRSGFEVAQVFGDAAGQVTDFAKNAALSLGLSQAEAQKMAGTLGLLLQNMGLNQQQAAGMSTEMVTLAAKMAAFHQTDPSEVLNAIQSGLAGNTRGLRQYGVSLDAARIQAKAVELGLIEQGQALDAASKAQASYALIVEQTTAAQEAEVSGARKYEAQIENLQATIGNALLPAKKALLQIANNLLSAFIPLVEVIAGNEAVVGTLTVAITAVVVALTAAKAILMVYSAVMTAAKVATLAWQAAQWLLNVALTANPIGIVIVAIAALVAILIVVWTQCEWFRNAVYALGNGIAWLAGVIWGSLVSAFNAIVGAVRDALRWLDEFLGKVRDAISLGGRIPGIGGLQLLAPAPAWSPGLTVAGTAQLANPYATIPAEATEDALARAGARANYTLNLYPVQADLGEVLIAFRRLELLGS